MGRDKAVWAEPAMSGNEKTDRNDGSAMMKPSSKNLRSGTGFNNNPAPCGADAYHVQDARVCLLHRRTKPG